MTETEEKFKSWASIYNNNATVAPLFGVVELVQGKMIDEHMR